MSMIAPSSDSVPMANVGAEGSSQRMPGPSASREFFENFARLQNAMQAKGDIATMPVGSGSSYSGGQTVQETMHTHSQPDRRTRTSSSNAMSSQTAPSAVGAPDSRLPGGSHHSRSAANQSSQPQQMSSSKLQDFSHPMMVSGTMGSQGHPQTQGRNTQGSGKMSRSQGSRSRRDGSQHGRGGNTLAIKLHSTKEDFDELAEVVVELDNADQVVEKMLETLAMKFPPESVMTISKGGRPAPYEDSEVSSRVSSRRPEQTTGGDGGRGGPEAGGTGMQPDEDMQVRYVEVPIIEEVIRHVVKKEVVEVEKRVPKYEVAWVEKIVEVPQIQYVDKQIEVEQIQEVVRHVPVKEIREVPKEVIKHIPTIVEKIVEQVIEVPGGIIEVPKPYAVEKQINIPIFEDREQPAVIAQIVAPVLKEGPEVKEVMMNTYEPRLVPVDVFVPVPVKMDVQPIGKTGEQHKAVDIPAAQFNSLSKLINPEIPEHLQLFMKLGDESVPMLPAHERVDLVNPIDMNWMHHHAAGTLHVADGIPATETKFSLPRGNKQQQQQGATSQNRGVSGTPQQGYSTSNRGVEQDGSAVAPHGYGARTPPQNYSHPPQGAYGAPQSSTGSGQQHGTPTGYSLPPGGSALGYPGDPHGYGVPPAMKEMGTRITPMGTPQSSAIPPNVQQQGAPQYQGTRKPSKGSKTRYTAVDPPQPMGGHMPPPPVMPLQQVPPPTQYFSSGFGTPHSDPTSASSGQMPAAYPPMPYMPAPPPPGHAAPYRPMYGPPPVPPQMPQGFDPTAFMGYGAPPPQAHNYMMNQGGYGGGPPGPPQNPSDTMNTTGPMMARTRGSAGSVNSGSTRSRSTPRASGMDAFCGKKRGNSTDPRKMKKK